MPLEEDARIIDSTNMMDGSTRDNNIVQQGEVRVVVVVVVVIKIRVHTHTQTHRERERKIDGCTTRVYQHIINVVM